MGRYLMLKKETTYGTPVVPDIAVRILSESLNYDPNNQFYRTIEAGRQVRHSQSIKIMSSGGWNMHPNFDKGIGEILVGLLGSISTVETEVGVRWTHTITPKVDLASAWPSFTVEKGLDALTGERYAGVGITNLAMTMNSGEEVSWNVGCFSKKPVTNAQLTPTHSTQDYLDASMVATQTLGGVATKFEHFNMSISGGAIPIHKPGSKEIDVIDYVPLEVTTSFTTRFLATVDLTDFVTNTYVPALVYKWKGPALGADFYSLQIDLPKMKVNQGDIKINQQDRLMQVRNTFAMHDGTLDAIKFTLVDGIATH